MRDDECWARIGQARERAKRERAKPGDGVDGIADALTDLLAEETAEKIVAFAVWQQAREEESYRWDLWGAANLINRGCAEEGFEYFRGWLLAQGEQVWRDAMTDPDTLADHPDVKSLAPGAANEFAVIGGGEAFLAAAQGAYTRVIVAETDADRALDAYVQAVGERVIGGPGGDGPTGQAWDFDDPVENRRRLPRLSALLQED